MLHDNIRTMRTIKGLTQGELATKVGCAVTTITKIETGTSSPSPRLLGLIANALDVPIMTLLQGSKSDATAAAIPDEILEIAKALHRNSDLLDFVRDLLKAPKKIVAESMQYFRFLQYCAEQDELEKERNKNVDSKKEE